MNNQINKNINKFKGNNIDKVNNLVINLNEDDEEEENSFKKKGNNYKYPKYKYQKNKIHNNNKINRQKDNKHSSLSGNNNISKSDNSNVQNFGCAPIFNNNLNKRNKK